MNAAYFQFEERFVRRSLATALALSVLLLAVTVLTVRQIHSAEPFFYEDVPLNPPQVGWSKEQAAQQQRALFTGLVQRDATSTFALSARSRFLVQGLELNYEPVGTRFLLHAKVQLLGLSDPRNVKNQVATRDYVAGQDVHTGNWALNPSGPWTIQLT